MHLSIKDLELEDDCEGVAMSLDVDSREMPVLEPQGDGYVQIIWTKRAVTHDGDVLGETIITVELGPEEISVVREGLAYFAK